MENMANWNKLNTEFENLINSLTDADWDKWESEREQKRVQRKMEMLERAKVHEAKIAKETPYLDLAKLLVYTFHTGIDKLYSYSPPLNTKNNGTKNNPDIYIGVSFFSKLAI